MIPSFAFVDMMPVLVAAEQLQSEVERLQGCFTESLQQTRESTNHKSRRRHYGEKNKKKDRDDLAGGLIGTDQFNSSVQICSRLPTHRQNHLAMETQVGAELNVSVDSPTGDSVVTASKNAHQSSADIDRAVESVRSFEDADRISNAVDGRIDDHAMPSADAQSKEGQRDHEIQTRQENSVVSRHKEDLSMNNGNEHDSVTVDICDVMTTNHEDESGASREMADSVSDVDAEGVDVEKKCLASDVGATQNDSEDMEPNPSVVLDVGENRCTVPDNYRWHEDSRPDDGIKLNDHDSESQNDTFVPRSPLAGDSNVIDDAVSVGGTVLDYTEPDCKSNIHTDLHPEVLQVEDNNVHQEHGGHRILDDESGSQQQQQGIQLGHKMDFREKWQDPARQSDKEMGKESNMSIRAVYNEVLLCYSSYIVYPVCLNHK